MHKGVVVTALAFFNEVAISSNSSSLYFSANLRNEFENKIFI